MMSNPGRRSELDLYFQVSPNQLNSVGKPNAHNNWTVTVTNTGNP
jgi:hypothetical protein